MNGYRIERLSPSNLGHLQSLYKNSFKLSADIGYLKKKYNTAAFGASYIGFLAFPENSNEAAAYYGVFPIRCSLNGVSVLAAQSGDTMTHPAHQGKGLFTFLAKATYQLARDEGVQFVFGFPNSNSYGGFIKKLDWKHYGDVNNYIIPVKGLPLAKIAKKFPVLFPVYQRFVKRRLLKLRQEPNLANSLSLQCPGRGVVVHDKAFFDYKKYYSMYQVSLGVQVILKVDGRLWVGDIGYCEKEQFLHTVAQLKMLALKLGCTTLQFSVFEGSFFDEILKTQVPVASKNAVGCLALTGDVDPTSFVYQGLDFDTF